FLKFEGFDDGCDEFHLIPLASRAELAARYVRESKQRAKKWAFVQSVDKYRKKINVMVLQN
ncbi:MAG: hypothetical protein P8I56_13600, partial [Paracoccaceae bacterium]|nr:hypothetical protein [Paracoccaceae bacterium]